MGGALDTDAADRPGAGGPEMAVGEDAREVEQLIAATWAVAARAGYSEPSVREILAEAGLSTKAFYRHFGSKDELLLVTYDEGTRVLVEHLERRMGAYDCPMERIAAWIEGYVRRAAPPAASRILPWSLGIERLALRFPDRFRQNEATIVAPLAREIANADATGAGRSPDPTGDAWLIFGCTADSVRRHLLDETVPDRETTLRLVGFAQRALGHPAGTGRPG